MATQLWLLRHGEAEPHGVTEDFQRALTAKGEEQSRAAGRALADIDVTFTAVYSSPRVRALDTAKLACEALGNDVVEHAPLGGGFGAGEALELALGHHDERILLVGHEPDFSMIVHDLTGARIEMKKGGIAGVRLRGTTSGELVTLMRPRELGGIAS